MTNNALIIFVRNLINGSVKTRLAATLGNDVAIDIYKQLLRNVHDKIKSLDSDKIVFYSDYIQDDIWEDKSFKKVIQEGNGLGERIENAFKFLFTAGYRKLIIIGNDCPELNGAILELTFERLNEFDIVIGPATDGGYYLLGLKNNYSFLFRNIEWSTVNVLHQTIERCDRNHLSYYLLPELSDIDEESDLIHFKNLIMPKVKFS